MAGLARRVAPAAALGGLAIIIVGVADPVFAGRTDAGDSGAVQEQPTTQEQPAARQRTAEEPASEPGATTPAVTCGDGDEVVGDAAMTQWGPVQVSATVANGQVCEVHAIDWPTSDRKSQMINSYAIPQLDAAATQSGMQFDYVSGATYTSQAYGASLQSILDAL
jgi:uncharacterized protein with FMN-binding domain